MNIVAPFGFYGAGNIGDEATLQGFARLLGRGGERIQTWVASCNPKQTAYAEPAFHYYKYASGRLRYLTWWIRFLADAYVFPGGTPIMDGLGDWPLCDVIPIVQSAERKGKRVVFIGVGTETLHQQKSKTLVSDILAPQVDYWSVRSRRDQRRLLELGVAAERVTVAADMAWLLDRASPESGRTRLRDKIATRGPLLGVNLNAEKAMLDIEPDLFAKMAKVLDALIERQGAHVVFICNEVRDDVTFDRAAAEAVRGCMRNTGSTVLFPNEYMAPQLMMSLIAACDLTLSSRYHFCLFSALQNVPFVPIRRSDKVADLCADIDWRWGTAIGAMDVEDLVHQCETLLSSKGGAYDGVNEKIEAMKTRAWLNEQALKALCPDVGDT